MRVTFGDAPSEVAAMLRTVLPQPVTVGTKVPTGVTPYVDDVPLVVVAQNGNGQPVNRAIARIPLRVMVWHRTDDEAHDLVQLVHVHVCGHYGPVVRTVVEAATPYVATDPDTGEPLASFTAIANVRAQRID